MWGGVGERGREDCQIWWNDWWSLVWQEMTQTWVRTSFFQTYWSTTCMDSLWWDCRINLKLMTLGSERVNPFAPKFKKYILPTIRELVRSGSIILFHLSKQYKAMFFVLCDVILIDCLLLTLGPLTTSCSLRDMVSSSIFDYHTPNFR